MADTLEINVAVKADATPLDAIRSGLEGLNAPLVALSNASAQAADAQQHMMQGMAQASLAATQAMQRADSAYVAAFKNAMQVMVDAKQITLQQAIGFDLQYTAQVFDQEQARLAAIRDS